MSKWTDFTESYWKPIPETARAFIVGVGFGVLIVALLWLLF